MGGGGILPSENSSHGHQRIPYGEGSPKVRIFVRHPRQLPVACRPGQSRELYGLGSWEGKKMIPVIRRAKTIHRIWPCPACNASGKKHSLRTRQLREIGITGPTILEVTCSVHFCAKCNRYYSVPMDHVAPDHGLFTNRVRLKALDLLNRQGMSLGRASKRMRLQYHVHVPESTLHDWLVDSMALSI